MMYADRTMMHVIYCYVVLVGSWNICLDLWSQNVPSDSAAQIPSAFNSCTSAANRVSVLLVRDNMSCGMRRSS